MYELIPIRKQDWEAIRVWRNEQESILRQDHKVTPEEQGQYSKRYYKQIEDPYPKQVLYSFLDEHDNLISYGGLVHISHRSKSSEISYLTNPIRKTDLLKYTTEWLIFLTLLREKAKNIGIIKKSIF